MASATNGIEVLFTTLERNNFFYGKLLDTRNLKLEQSYFIRKRWLLNRLVTGSGVVCGLDLAVDPGTPGLLVVQPGLAIDASGREIIVPEAVSVDATQLTDAQGNPTGPVSAGDTIAVCLCYAEARVNPVPVLVADCDNPGDCAPDLVREHFRLLVRPAPTVLAPPPSCPLPGDSWTATDLDAQLRPLISADCSAVPADSCVPLAHFTPSTNTLQTHVRPLIYGNRLLYQLLVCLGDQVAQVAGAALLLYESGDGQSAKANQQVAAPLVVRVVDGAGNPVNGAAVAFTASGGGVVTAAAPQPAGRYETTWTLGAAGAQAVTAQAAGSTLSVTFHATIVP
jgi:hypothetical protein